MLSASCKNKNRADVIIVTKCPDFENINKNEIIKKIKPTQNQSVFFSKIVYDSNLTYLLNEEYDNVSRNVILVTGIANAQPLVNHINKAYNLLHHQKFSDHYQFKEKDIDEIHNLLVKFEEFSPIIVTTEKDAMRLVGNDLEPMIENKPWFYQGIKVEIDRKKEFDNLVKTYVQENRRDY